MEEKLYVELPSGYEIYDKIKSLDITNLDSKDLSLIKSLENTNIPKYKQYNPNKVCKLNSYLYGLVQASREFYIKMNKILLGLNFNNCKSDPCLFKISTLL